MRPVAFAIPGSLDTPTGGYAYDRAVIAGLRRRGHPVDVVELGDGFPFPDATTVEGAVERLAAVPAETALLVDGLAYGVLPAEPLRHLASPPIVILHHPLGLETGLDPATADRLLDVERQAVAAAAGIVVTSSTTAETVADLFDIDPDRITVAMPGTERQSPAPFRTGAPAILTVASLSERKGQLDLLAALEPLSHLDWTLSLVGAEDVDPAYAERVRAAASDHPAAGRITVAGAMPPDAVAEAYRAADIFVLPSHYEGYGMVVAEALSFGLPVVSTRAGAIPEVLGDAGILVEAGSVADLSRALDALVRDSDERLALRERALSRAASLPTWDQTVETIAAVISA